MAFKRCEVDGNLDTPTKCRGPAAAAAGAGEGAGNIASTAGLGRLGTNLDVAGKMTIDLIFQGRKRNVNGKGTARKGGGEGGQAAKAKTQKQTIKIK